MLVQDLLPPSPFLDVPGLPDLSFSDVPHLVLLALAVRVWVPMMEPGTLVSMEIMNVPARMYTGSTKTRSDPIQVGTGLIFMTECLVHVARAVSPYPYGGMYGPLLGSPKSSSVMGKVSRSSVVLLYLITALSIQVVGRFTGRVWSCRSS